MERINYKVIAMVAAISSTRSRRDIVRSSLQGRVLEKDSNRMLLKDGVMATSITVGLTRGRDILSPVLAIVLKAHSILVRRLASSSVARNRVSSRGVATRGGRSISMDAMTSVARWPVAHRISNVP